MDIKKFYLENYPSDEIGIELSEKATFSGLLFELYNQGDVYKYIGVGDSVIRERIFEKLADQLQVSVQYIYKLWD